MEKLEEDVRQRPDDFQYERAERFGVSPNGILYALRRLKISHKKTLFHPRANEVDRLTFWWKIIEYRLQARPIVYLDESGFALNSPRTHGYTRRGKRCYDKKDWHSIGRLNAIGAIVGFIFLTVCLFDCIAKPL